MKKNALIVFGLLLVILLVILSLYANFYTAPYIKNVEINDSNVFSDKVIVNVYVENYFFKLNKDSWCLVSNNREDRINKTDDRWTKTKNGYCSFTIDAGDYYIYVKDKYGNTNDLYSQKAEVNKILEAKFDKEAIYLYKGGSEKVNYDLVVVGQAKDNVKLVSTNTQVVTIEDGVAYGKDYGIAELQIRDDDKIYGSIKVHVPTFITQPKIDTTKPYLKCLQFNEEDAKLIDKILFDRIDSAGYGTRAGVVEAARFAALEFAYRIDYFYENGRLNNYKPYPRVDGEGRYYHRGFYLTEAKFQELDKTAIYVGPAAWGCNLKNFTNWGKWRYGQYYANGFDCSGFVTWALLNGGFDIGDIGAGGDGSGQKSLPDLGTKLSITPELMNSGRVKVGDLIGLDGHAAILAGWDDNNYYIAESLNTTGGVVITKVSRSKLENRRSIYTFVVLMDNVYKKDGNLTNYWA